MIVMKKNVIKKLHRRFVSYLHGENQNIDLENLDNQDLYDVYINNAM